jgi:hypothetical protein
MIDVANPVNRQHPLARDLFAWWMYLPGLAGGQYLPNLMRCPVFSFTAPYERHLKRLSDNADTYTNAPQWGTGTNRPGGFGHMVHAHPTSTFGRLRAGDVVGGTWDFTLITNVNVQSHLDGFDTIVSQEVGANDFSLLINQTSHTVAFYLTVGGHLDTSTVLATQRWYQLAVTWTATDSGRLTIYVNGFQDVTGTGFTSRNTNVGVDFNVGADFTFNRPLSGFTDDTRIYRRCLSALEIRDVYRNSVQGYPGLLRRARPALWAQSSAAATTKYSYWAWQKFGQPLQGF